MLGLSLRITVQATKALKRCARKHFIVNHCMEHKPACYCSRRITENKKTGKVQNSLVLSGSNVKPLFSGFTKFRVHYIPSSHLVTPVSDT